MKKTVSLWALVCVCLFAAWQFAAYAQSPSINFPPGVFFDRRAIDAPSGGGGGPTWNPNSTQAAMQTLSHTSPATFSVTLDATPASTDVIVIGVANGNGGNSPISGVTVNSSAATAVIGDSNPNEYYRASIWQISGITTPSLTVVVSATGGMTDIGVSVGVLKSLTSSTETATGNNNQTNMSDPQTLTAAITVPSSGIGLVYLSAARNSVPSSSNSTIDTTTEISDATPWQGFFAHTTTAGSWNPSLQGTPAFAFSVPGLAAAAWH